MKFILALCSFIALTLTLYAQQSLVLTGTVKDKKGEVLPGAGVYVSGYKIGTSTNNNGVYTLNLKPGNYDILVQMIGYKTVNKNAIITDKNLNLNIVLDEDAVQLSEVTIKPDPNREGYIKLFKDFFIGTTPNAKLCKLINPNVLIIDYDKEEAKLSVKTNQFLIIENKALGYRIKYLVNAFEYDSRSRIIYYEGFPSYEDLKGSTSRIKKWSKKRLEAYSGSSQHFFTSLYNGKSKDEGFIINKLIKKIDSTRPSDEVIKSNIRRIISKQQSSTGGFSINGDSLSYWTKQKAKPKEISILNTNEVLPDTLVHTYNENIKQINYEDLLYVIYTKEKEHSDYANIIGMAISRPLTMPNYQISLATLLLSPCFFYKNGSIYNPKSMLYSGYWAWEKVADSVPMDYLPSPNK
ncbi:carboxypeptidase-like regulatory domain-containing protein [Pedobacter mucosus]|uniref:carboxypeptidase-like regulatory domain-containing protein n=1 Tax=Pedobacter mucosus TaxID=2895286 RepID=UPI001EE4790A|nr:carboxypeptidase-like regulatory domain-containing protein [Pedobacter mucosus]UKT62470.1 carboxypeptidase-like regulatory domain-containing protein [Pedobacter mucosus]